MMDAGETDFMPNGRASDGDVREAESHFGRPLPTQYRRFMSSQDGGEGFIGGQYLVLWRTSELFAFNRDYEAAHYAPGLLLFGSNGAGEAFAFDMRYDPMPVVMVPFIGMSLKDAKTVAESFDGFLARLADGSLF